MSDLLYSRVAVGGGIEQGSPFWMEARVVILAPTRTKFSQKQNRKRLERLFLAQQEHGCADTLLGVDVLCRHVTSLKVRRPLFRNSEAPLARCCQLLVCCNGIDCLFGEGGAT